MKVLLFLSFLLSFCLSSSAASVPLGTTLTPANSTTTWTSPNNTFTLSFLPTPQNPQIYTLSISYTPSSLPVWSAGGGNLTVSSAAALTLTSTGNLQLTDGRNSSVLWQSSTSDKGVAFADLGDDGNLKLTTRNSTLIWQSFDQPTDTLLQTQSLTVGRVLRSGSYSFSLSNIGNMTLKWNNNIEYYNKGLNTLNSSFSNISLVSPVLTLQTNGIVSLSDTTLPSPAVIAYSSDYGESGEPMRFLKLDKDGNFRAYSIPGGSGNSPVERWAAVADQCEVFGRCGNMGICSYNETSPICGCPSQNFEFVDENDSTKGCKRKLEIQDCPGNSTMLELDGTQFLTYPPEISTEQFFVGITACRTNCLSGSSCVASTALADGSGLCYLKVSTFVSGYQSSALPSTSYVKVCAPGILNALPPALGQAGSKSSSKLTGWLVAVLVIGTIAGLVVLELGVWWCFCQNSPKFGPSSAQYALLEYASGAPVQFSFKELHRSTKGFKEKLGEGGFGAVYRGVLANRTVVAVKQLEGIEQGEKQFRMEVATISSTHHLNLVRLIGFCSEGRHRLLVYEFMKNSSLDSFLFSSESAGKFNWATRYKVAIGTARGITYLHEECRDCIVHCDIKPENILLDENYNAKVSDFGLAKLLNPKDHRHRTITSVRGTRGYLAPEWLANLPITAKSDVYSFGMVLLEIFSGRRNFDVSEETGRKKFSVWAYEEFEKGHIGSIVDKRLVESEIDMDQLDRAIQVSFWCIQEQPSQRPSMGKVVQMLEGIMELERPPAPKATDSSVSGTSGGSASVSNFSTFTASSPAVNLKSSSFVPEVKANSSSEISRSNAERASSSLLASNQSL